MIATRGWILCGAVVWLTVGSGCATKSLKESNRRLRESNDRLIAENTRLEADLQQLRQDFGQGFAAATPAPNRIALDPAPAPAEPDSDLVGDLNSDGVYVDRVSDGVKITLEDRVFFAPGQAALSGSGKSRLSRVARVIGSEYSDRTIRVEGHTDDTPVRKVKRQYPTNWELSTARACAVVRHLISAGGIEPRSIYPAGFAYYRPASHRSGSNSKNRRVEITIMDPLGL